MTIYNDTAHANSATLAQRLGNSGYLSQDQVGQMCDGTVSVQNFNQARQAMSDAYASGDTNGYRLATALAQNLRVALGTQLNAERQGFAPRGETQQEGMLDQNRDAIMNAATAQSQGQQVVPRDMSAAAGGDACAPTTSNSTGANVGAAVCSFALGALVGGALRGRSNQQQWGNGWYNNNNNNRRPNVNIDNRRTTIIQQNITVNEQINANRLRHR